MDPTKKELYTAKRTTNLDLNDVAISETWEHIRSDDAPENWLLLKVDGGKGTLYASGISLDELLLKLDDDDMYFGVIRATVDGRTKFYHIFFVGTNTGGMKKGKGSLYKSSIFNLFDGAHGELTFTGGLEEATKAAFLNQIQSLSRAKPENIII